MCFPARRPRRAFSLIELLVTISIIALLIGVLLPALGKTREVARSARCLANMRSLARANYQYANDSGVFLGWASGTDRKMLLYPYLQQGLNNQELETNQVWSCPANARPINASTGEVLEASYGFNTRLNFRPFTAPVNPSNTVMVGDGGVNDANQPLQATHLMSPGQKKSAGLCALNPRHGDQVSANVGWADGHANTQRVESPIYPWTPDAANASEALSSNPARPAVTQTDPDDPNYKDTLWDLF